MIGFLGLERIQVLFPTSKGKYSGHKFGGSKGSALGRLYAKRKGITIQRNADET